MLAPQLGDEIGIVGEVGVEGEDIIAARFGESGFHSAGESRTKLANHAGAERSRGLRGAVTKPPSMTMIS